MIGGTLSSVGNGYIDDEVDNMVLKVASSAVLGGTISEIGGGKFANGAVTGAYSMLFNEAMHGDENKKVKQQRNLEQQLNSKLKELQVGQSITGDEFKREILGQKS